MLHPRPLGLIREAAAAALPSAREGARLVGLTVQLLGGRRYLRDSPPGGVARDRSGGMG